MKEYSKGIYVKFQPEEVEMIHERMKEAGVQNMSAFIRKMVLNGYMIIPKWPELNGVLSLHSRISNNLNQYAKKANETGNIYREDIAELKEMHDEQTKLLKKRSSQSFIFMMQIQRREIKYYEKATAWLCGLPAVQGDWGRKTSGGRLFCADRSGTETTPQQAKMRRVYTGALLANL